MSSVAEPPAAGSGRAPVAAAVVSATLATAVVLSGVTGTGQRLVRDFVAVPEPAAPLSLLPTTASALRAWPLDAVSWVASGVVPTGVQQQLILVAALALAGVGTGLLVRHAGAAAAAAAAWVAIWNPYVTERLLLGHGPTLLGYACLPWIVIVVRSSLRTRQRHLLLVVVAIPASLTPWGGVVAAVTAVLADLSRGDRTLARSAAVAAVASAWCLPWVLPAVLVGGVGADPDGPAAFALADDSGLGTWFSALMGGGVWAAGAQPLSRSDPVALAASLGLLGCAVAAVLGLAVAATGPGEFSRRGAAVAGLALLLLVGPATVAWWASGPGLEVMSALQQVPGVALFRDQHRMLAPGILALAVLVAVAVAWLARHGGRTASALGCVLVAALSVASVPDLPSRMRADYRPVTYPADWADAVRSLDAAPATPTVLSLPWQPLRLPGWAGEPPFLDPLPRAVSGTVLTSTALTVQRPAGSVVVDDAPVGEDWASGSVTAASLRRHGVTHVVEWLDTPGSLASRRDGWRLVHSGPSFTVWDVSGAQ
ncbi:MAG TPA: hypothetical protein PLX57_07630 [Ornithinibacter sp.]|uniref:hypothetical protein n=1 Tax=Ornithinibacter sp. TaxID=2862748 RepID=UPI002BFE0D27|nr:hypothetical protein [Ornithinibacter sp.]HQA14404.1 hypothetical protein [Ornithinibacter sp.]HQD68507.1 hypothetical protein [Ornithinibacter sp.]HQV82960.1 hypothetical protein [Ornithinibacter sp.]HRA26431.1 hypothetical protein [Ornithinibacter sp.]